MPLNRSPSFCLISALETYGKWTEAGNEIRAWSLAMNGDVHYGLNIPNYSIFDKYDITMVELTSPMIPVAYELKKRSKTRVVGLVEGELMPRQWSSRQFAAYARVLNAVDMVGIINDKAYEAISSLTKKPIHMIGIPYPLTWAQENRDVRNSGAVIELGSTPNGRGGIWTMAAFNQLQMRGAAFPVNKEDELATGELGGGRIAFYPMTDWQRYFKLHPSFYLGLHLDNRATWGRFSLDCAAASIPCISTAGSKTQRVLFPALTVEHFETSKAVHLAKRLLQDKRFYQHVVSYANRRIKQFDLQPTKERFLNFMML